MLPERRCPICQSTASLYPRGAVCHACRGEAVLAVLTLSLRCRRNFPEEQVRCRVWHKFAWTESGSRSPQVDIGGSAQERSLSCMQCNAESGECEKGEVSVMYAMQCRKWRMRKNSACLRSNLLREGCGSAHAEQCEVRLQSKHSDKKLYMCSRLFGEDAGPSWSASSAFKSFSPVPCLPF